MGYSPWGRKELDTTERLHFTSLHVAAPIYQMRKQRSGKQSAPVSTTNQ